MQWLEIAVSILIPAVSGLLFWIMTTDRRVTRHDERLRNVERDLRTALKRQNDFLK